MLTPDEQKEIVRLAKNMGRVKEKMRRMAASGWVSAAKMEKAMQDAEAKLRDYLKECG